MPNALITGGTGFIGQALVKELLAHHYKVTVITRNIHQEHLISDPNVHYIDQWQAVSDNEIDLVVNLAGMSLAEKRWSKQVKADIIASRVETTQKLVKCLSSRQVNTVISGSAIGWYGHSDQTGLDEEAGFTNDFNHQLCAAWEQSIMPVVKHANRVILLRIGIVLDNGGALEKMLPPFKLGLGGPMGKGDQYWSWIHRQDLIRMILWLTQKKEIEGPVNATAPAPCSQAYFSRTLGKVLKRPALLPMPSFMASLMIGEFASEVLLKGQHVIPKKAIEGGFIFEYPDLVSALTASVK